MPVPREHRRDPSTRDRSGGAVLMASAPWALCPACTADHGLASEPCTPRSWDFGYEYRAKVARQREVEGRAPGAPRGPAERAMVSAQAYREHADQCRADGDDRRADLYALGAILLREVAIALADTG